MTDKYVEVKKYIDKNSLGIQEEFTTAVNKKILEVIWILEKAN